MVLKSGGGAFVNWTCTSSSNTPLGWTANGAFVGCALFVSLIMVVNFVVHWFSSAKCRLAGHLYELVALFVGVRGHWTGLGHVDYR